MIMLRQIKRYTVHALWVLVILFVAACGNSGSEQEGTLPSGEQQVAYGASLSEWEEATQSTGEDSDQVAVTSNSTDEETQSVSPLASTVLASPLEIVPASAGVDSASSAAERESDAARKEALVSAIGVPFTLDNVVYREILWDGLIPIDYSAEALMSKYNEQMAELEDGSPEASELYKKMQAEFNSAPVNDVLNEVPVRIPGFITPLEYTDDLITEFLLVPYFGACIHTPPPPVNQTVLVQVAEGNGIKPEDSYSPIWVMGKLTTEGTTTELATAGYNIQEATFEPYESQR